MTGRRTAGPLPQETAEYLRSLIVHDGPETHAERRARYQRAAGYRDILKDAGWPLSKVADVFGISRQAVDQWGSGVSDRAGHPAAPPVPPPPTRPVQPPALVVAEKDAARMRVLLPLALTVRKNTPQDGAARKAGRELAELMASHARAGVSLTEIGRASGQSRTVVAFRLARYGYHDLVSEGTSRYINRRYGDGRAAAQPRPDEPCVSTEDAQRMRVLHEKSSDVRRNASPDSPEVQAATELADLMAYYVHAGVGLTAIGKAFGQSRMVVSYRLARYGHEDCVSPGAAKYVTPKFQVAS